MWFVRQGARSAEPLSRPSSSDGREENFVVDIEFGGRVAVGAQLGFGPLNAAAEFVYVPKRFHRFGNNGVPITVSACESFLCPLAVKAAGTLNFDAVPEPVKPPGSKGEIS
jgi:hypothetical protein